MFVLFRSTGCRLSYCLFSALRRQFNRLYTCAYNPHIYKAAEHFLFSVFFFFFLLLHPASLETDLQSEGCYTPLKILA